MHIVFAVADSGLSSECRFPQNVLRQAVLLRLLRTPDSTQLCETLPAGLQLGGLVQLLCTVLRRLTGYS